MVKSLYLAFFLLFGAYALHAQINRDLSKADGYFSQGTEEGYRNAIAIYTRYEKQLTAAQLNIYGFSYWKLKDYQPALKYFEIAASKSDETAIFNSGYNYYYGNGAEKSYQKALNYLLRSGDSYTGLPEILHMIGHCLEAGANIHGTLAKPDYWGARTYFLTAAEKGNVDCMVHIADYYNNSGKIETNYSEAKKWYGKACENDSKDACTKLAQLNAASVSLSQTKTNQAPETPIKKKEGGFLKALGAVADGLNTYNSSRAGVGNAGGELSNGGMTPSGRQWSEWRSCPSFKKIQYSVIYDGPYDVGKSDLHYWRVKIKNLYSVPVYGGFTIGTSISDLRNIYFYGSEKESKGASITIYLKAYEISGNNEIRIKSSSNILVDVTQLSYSPEGGAEKLRTDSGDLCMRCKLYPSEKGCL